MYLEQGIELETHRRARGLAGVAVVTQGEHNLKNLSELVVLDNRFRRCLEQGNFLLKVNQKRFERRRHCVLPRSRNTKYLRQSAKDDFP